MRPARLAFVTACVLACTAHGAWACNPDPPRPPILQGFSYDAAAAEVLLRDATSVVAARLELELALQDSAGVARSDFVFAVLEGWRAETPRTLTIGGHWVDCAIEPRQGRVFLLYLDGQRLLHAVPVSALDFEIALLGEPDWFYDVRGRLVRGPED
ncbi:MAG TPA: hypothetical protein PLS34_07095 [Gammaproteobacteria bacterium]|nr:hypothetical protein [Gammaproteobacteria bacterium]